MPADLFNIARDSYVEYQDTVPLRSDPDVTIQVRLVWYQDTRIVYGKAKVAGVWVDVGCITMRTGARRPGMKDFSAVIRDFKENPWDHPVLKVA